MASPVWFCYHRAAVELRSVRVTIDSILVQDDEPTAADVAGRIVVMSVRAGSYFDFNRVGTEIWCMLTKPRRVSEIFDSLSRMHNVDAKTLYSDVMPFLQTLVTNRLVRVV
jgi:Coenzyme PQQ synthesis protein D (PqqD)